jgi:hypothetical protein
MIFEIQKRGLALEAIFTHRGWTLLSYIVLFAFPIPMRYWLQTNKKLYAKIHSLVIKELHQHYIKAAEIKGISDCAPGSISFTQRWGSACNLNPHMHVVCPDGVYTSVDDKPRWHNLVDCVTDEKVADLITKIAQSVMRLLKKQGLLDERGEVVQNPAADALFQDSESLSLASYCNLLWIVS